MNRWKSIKEIMYDLVRIQSDTYSSMEVSMADHILKLIEEQDYFKNNKELYGSYHVPDDPYNRKSVWALRKGKSSKTIVLNGHLDCVEIDCYSSLKPYALNPDELKKHMKDMFKLILKL